MTTPKAQESARYTAGPWKVWEKGWGMFSVDSATREICSVWSRTDQPKTIPDANARLIAAAPELLEACQMLLDAHNAIDPSYAYGARAKAKAAITKAIGGQI